MDGNNSVPRQELADIFIPITVTANSVREYHYRRIFRLVRKVNLHRDLTVAGFVVPGLFLGVPDSPEVAEAEREAAEDRDEPADEPATETRFPTTDLRLIYRQVGSD